MYFKNQADVDIGVFKKICETVTERSSYPMAKETVKNILIYDGEQIRHNLAASSPSQRSMILDEIHRAFKDGPGVIVVRGFYGDLDFVDRGTEIFNRIIVEEGRQSENRGDHFSKGSPNARIWNVVGKLLEYDPQYFYDYFKNPLIALVAEAWLGPAYQMTAQVNLVRPGSAAQVAHRDYHLGFLDDEVIARYPVTAQVMSQYLTLQGGIAHSDMPIESGPTILLPHSQKYDLGYLAMRQADFIDYFNQRAVQCELRRGDAVFFSPALFHAAGENRTADKERMANLLQVSSSFGKPMEKVDLIAVAQGVYPLLLEKQREKQREAQTSLEITEEMEAVIKTAAVGYPFPSDLDKMKPKPGSLTPASDQDVIRSCLLLGKTFPEFQKALAENQV